MHAVVWKVHGYCPNKAKRSAKQQRSDVLICFCLLASRRSDRVIWSPEKSYSGELLTARTAVKTLKKLVSDETWHRQRWRQSKTTRNDRSLLNCSFFNSTNLSHYSESAAWGMNPSPCPLLPPSPYTRTRLHTARGKNFSWKRSEEGRVKCFIK